MVVTQRREAAQHWLPTGRPLAELAAAVASPVVDLAAPWRLGAVEIPKPWGRELWYTGIERRGESTVTDGARAAPLSHLLALGRAQLLGGEADPVLLKVLDPHPQPVWGDLYFELHREKEEVYFVVGVDRTAWPEGIGAIRCGFDPRLRRRWADDESFRRAYLEAVLAYEVARREIDQRLDERRRCAGIDPAAPVSPALQRQWLEALPAPLRRREARLRRRMEAFTRLWPLDVGSVVRIARRVPHALQHGVRVVEFQTPVYERLILSFSQKVLTQSHWDTAEAVAIMELDADPLPPLELLEDEGGVRREQVAEFRDFAAERWTLEARAAHRLEGDGYRLVLAAVGAVEVGGLRLEPEEAALVPCPALPCRVENLGEEKAVCLVASPRF
ncbi:MAG: hypothetical protein KatS3mg124_0996 [Porticoccaceae bacterium]|nr:MAG: hypothetical protein KatS3mg124_0996 [Porticoccaceae bacterium]